MSVEKVKKDIHGIVPVIISPFHEDGNIGWDGLENLIKWYIAHGAQALFAICQSSEMQFLSLAERRDLAIFTVKQIDGCIPVFTSGEPPQTPCIRQAVTSRLF